MLAERRTPSKKYQLIRTFNTSSRIQPHSTCVCGQYVAFPVASSSKNDACQVEAIDGSVSIPIQVQGKITAIHCYSGDSDGQLRVIVATRKEVSMHIVTSFDDSYSISSEILAENLESKIVHIDVDSSGSMVAFCMDHLVEVFFLNSQSRIHLLGHEGNLVTSKFLKKYQEYDYSSYLVSIAEDRTFKIWDIESKECFFRSSIICASPLVSLSIETHRPRFYVGSENGAIRVFDLVPTTDRYSCQPRELTTIDVFKLLPTDMDASLNHDSDDSADQIEVISSAPFWKVKGVAPHSYNNSLEVSISQDVSSNDYLIGMCSIPSADNDILLISTTRRKLLVLDSKSFMPMKIISPASIENMFSGHLSAHLDQEVLTCVLSDPFSGRIAVIEVPMEERLDNLPETLLVPDTNIRELLECIYPAKHSEWVLGVFDRSEKALIAKNVRTVKDLETLDIDDMRDLPFFVLSMLERIKTALESRNSTVQSFLFNGEKLKGSLLAERKVSIASNSANSAKSSKSLDKPVTFRSKVKSSGYMSAPIANKMFTRPSKPSTGIPKKPIPKKLPGLSCPPVRINRLLEIKPAPLPDSFCHSQPLTAIKYSKTGNSILVASADKSARFHRRTESSKWTTKELTGHNGSVLSIDASSSPNKYFGPLCLTSSTDATVRLWSVEKNEHPLLIIDQGSRKSPKFKEEIKFASFFHQDRFICLSQSNAIHCYSYRLDKPESGSVKPSLNYHEVHHLKTYTIEAQNVSAFRCIKLYPSNLLFCAGTDKTISIWDVNSNTRAVTIPSSHSRAPHCIAIGDYEGCNDLQRVFITTSICDSIKLWDIRDPSKPQMQLFGHLNKFAPVECCISPCGNYVVTGSEVRHFIHT